MAAHGATVTVTLTTERGAALEPDLCASRKNQSCDLIREEKGQRKEQRRRAPASQPPSLAAASHPARAAFENRARLEALQERFLAPEHILHSITSQRGSLSQNVCGDVTQAQVEAMSSVCKLKSCGN
ncbi:hypothetical protein KOW79_016612 [Hemibagrus wyckioides]|uniref:Uncharacterized protein n=1 Tax=Hemibagrus wyckioides TaxID=337641 RepID=A0A9D3NDF7_9TELE|nr:hypothetical protein KOW79_016612 [Hemibagrus wyckioides]